MEFKEELYTFPSGLKLIMVKAPGFYTSKFKIIFRVGAEDEESEQGISHLIEHSVFKGTSHLSQEQIAAKFDALSADVDASTSSEFTTYKASFPRPNLEEVLKLYSSMLFDSVFDPVELEKEKRVIIEEIKMREDMPEQAAFDNLVKMMYKGSRLENDVAGEIDKLKKVTRAEMLEYKNEHYNEKNAVISVIGDYDMKDVISIIDEHFNKPLIKNGKKEKVWSSPLVSRQEKIVKIKPINQANIILAYKTLPYEDMDRVRLGIIAYILGGSMSSRLFTRIRNELSLCYSVYAFTINYKRSGFLGISLGTSPENALVAIEEVKKEIHKILKDGVTEEEFNAAKSMRLNKLLMERDLPQASLSYLAYTGELLDNSEIEKIIRSVTREDALNIFRKVVKEEDVFLSYVGKKIKGI